MKNNKPKTNHGMALDHIGFAILLFFLLIAPKIPINISGGSNKSSLSLGFIGFIVWFLLKPDYLVRFPRQKNALPVVVLLIFSFYAFLISLISKNLISIIYGTQFLFYVIASTIFFRKYLSKAKKANSFNTVFKIFFAFMSIYAFGALVSVFTGPIYPWQTIYTLRPWGDMWIRQGVGFSEGQNMTAEILIIFVAAALYLYQGSRIKKNTLIFLSLAALFSTLCRSPIVALISSIFMLAIYEFFCNAIVSGRINKKILLNYAYLTIAIFFVMVAGVFFYIANRRLSSAIFAGFGFGEGSSFMADLNTRISLWLGGVGNWETASITSIMFGNGFRSSMGIVSETGAWLTSHNFFVTVLAEFGIIGFLLFISFILVSVLSYLRIIFAKNVTTAALARFGFVSFIAIMIHNLAGEFLYSPVSISMLALVLIMSLI